MKDNIIDRIKERLRAKLPGEKARQVMAPLRIPEHKPLPGTKKAGVLILVFPRKGELSTILIKRTEYPGPHSGQISFPGGKTERGDGSQIDTALREAYEETGIAPEKITVLGVLTPLYISVSNLEVLPVVGFSEKQPEFMIDPREVEYLVYLPLKELSQPDLIIEKKLSVNGFSIKAPGYALNNEFIWGATAMILAEFAEVISEAARTTR